MDESNPTVRALRSLELLQTHPGITAGQLGGRLGVCERAARRYVEILRAAGVQIEATRGRYGGYHLGHGLRLRPLMFTAPEALSLAMAVLEGGHQADAVDDPVQTALSKIIRVLPEPMAGPVEAIRRVSARRRPPGQATPNPQTTALLVEACETHQRIRVDYQSTRNFSRPMEIDPWAVVVRYGRWYLLGWSHNVNARRVLRVDRIALIEKSAGTFEPPADLDPIHDIDTHLAQAWPHRVVVDIDAPLEQARSWVPHQLGMLESLADDRTRLVGSTADFAWYAGHLTALNAAYTIIEPAALADTARRLGERLQRAGSTPAAG
jgi:predicted DNA-binding transcriptional regulator YafY